MAATRLCGAPKPSLPTTSRPTLTPQARRTFQESFDSFEKTVQRYSRTDDREFSNTTLRDVRDAAKEVERQLAARQCMRNMKRLEPFLNGLEAYSKVIEVLCNGTPFLSWIWAPIKLMMQLATDHISAFEKLLAAYSQIAAMLPRFDRLGTALQDKPDFQQALAVVYSDILTFHEYAYKLFRRNGWICFFKSSWGQFGSRFNCILDSLAKHATLVDQEANAYLISETMQWRREALQTVAKTEKDRSTAQLTAALAWLGLETVPHCGQAYQDNLLHRLINDCCDGTTDWILKHQRMRQWLQNGRGGPILWLKGKPGSGKSTLCAKIVQFLRAPRQSTVLFCFYSYIVSSTYPDPVVFILATLVSQILRQRSDLATYVYEEFVAENRPLSIRSLQELLSNLLPQLVMPRILIDGIDECIRYDIHGKPCDLTPVKDVLVSILQLENPMQACAPTKILVVSRDILELVGKLSKRPTVALDQESDALTADITRYATKCLETIRDRFANLVGVDDVLNDVKRNVVSKSQGMFLWVRLVLAQLEFDAYNLDDLENAVANMPHSLHDFYSRIVHRIMLYPIQSRERTINILKWMLCSKRPLRVVELQDAIVFASGAVSLSERSKLPPKIVDLCKPLIQADDNGQISFVHFTVQEYLTESNFISLRDAESCTTITCLNYLTFSLNLSNSSIPATQKAVDVGRCLYSLQPYAHEHWLDHLLAFAVEVSRSTDQQLEAFLASFFFIYSHQYTRYLDSTDDLQVDILAAQTLEPRLRYLERYEHHHKFLCAYVVYRHARQMHFENPVDYREPLDPTPLSVVQLEFATQIDYLLSSVTVPGLTQEQLSTFKTLNRSYAFVCRFPGCTGMLAGFPTDDLRTQHEMTHKPALFCTHSGCKYSLPFTSRQSLCRHAREFHDPAPKSIPKSIRRRQATLLRHKNGHSGTLNFPGGLDVHVAGVAGVHSTPQPGHELVPRAQANTNRGPKMPNMVRPGMNLGQPQPSTEAQRLPIKSQQERFQAASNLLRDKPSIVLFTDSQPFPADVLNTSIRNDLPQDVKTWQQLRLWAGQNPHLVDGRKLLELQVLHFQDMVGIQNMARQPGGVAGHGFAPPVQVNANQDPIRTSQQNMPNMAAPQVTPQDLQEFRATWAHSQQANLPDEQLRDSISSLRMSYPQQQATLREMATHRGSMTKAEVMKPIAIERLSATNPLSEQRTHSLPMDSGVASEVQAHGSILDGPRLLTPEPISQADGFPAPDTRDSAYTVGLADEDVPSDAPDHSDYGDPGAPRPFPPEPPSPPTHISIVPPLLSNRPSQPPNVNGSYYVSIPDDFSLDNFSPDDFSPDLFIRDLTTEEISLFGKVFGDDD